MKKITSILLFIFYFSGYSQMSELKSIDLKIDLNSNEERNVFNFEKDGLLYSSVSSEFFNSNQEVTLVKYNTDLEFEWSSVFEINYKFEIAYIYNNKTHFYILVKEIDDTEIKVYKFDIKNGENSIYEGNMLTEFDVQHFVVNGNKAFIGGTYSERPVIVAFNFVDLTSKILQDLYNNNLSISSIETVENDERLWVFLKDERSCASIIKQFGYDGKVKQSNKIGDRRLNLISSKLLKTKQDKIFIVGNYAESCNQQANGLYILDTEEIKDDKIQLKPFDKLSNFYSFLSEKKQERIKQRNQLREKAGRTSSQKYRILLHDIYNFGDENVLVGEVFYADYKSPNNPMTNIALVRIGQNLYNSFRFSHAIFCGLDENGKIVWDNSIPMKNTESSELSTKVQINKVDDKYFVAFPNEGKINSVVLNKNEKVNKIESFNIDQYKRRIDDNDFVNLFAWYDNYFLVWGETDKLTNSKFYIKKLSYNIQQQN